MSGVSRALPQLAVEAQGVSKRFGDGAVAVEALHPTDLTITRGEFVALTGSSGSGKSTLLHILGGLERPSNGRVLVGGTDLSSLSRTQLAKARNRDIGFVFQFFNLLPALTVVENVALPAVIAGRREADWKPRARELLGRVGLGGFEERYPAQLSGGQQQRVAIARALISDPTVLLADEPTGNLDSKSGGEVVELLHESHRNGLTIVLVTHDPGLAEQADRQCVMADGTLKPITLGS
jgi:putative ABC transport system ATP-binding protein